MTELKYKTNINCGGCIKSVTPYLNKIPGICWEVDTTDKDKVLTAKGESIPNNEIISRVKEAGFEIVPIKKKLFGLF